MLNLFQHLFEESLMEEKEVSDARKKVRAEMRKVFTFSGRTSAAEEDSEYPYDLPPMASGTAVKPYIPPTAPTGDDANPFGLRETPLG